MAFDFLGKSGNGYEVKDVVDAGTAGYQIYRALKGRKGSKQLKGSTDAAKRAAKLAEKAGDPTSARFKNLESLFNERHRRELVQAIDKVMRVASRAKARGGAGFAINPERRDESRYKALATAFMEAKDRSRIDARNTLLGQSQALQGAAKSYPVGYGEQRDQGNYDLESGANSAIGPFARGVRDVFQNRQPKEDITWNGPRVNTTRQPYSVG